MESGGDVVPHRAPRSKLRRRPVTDRERGLDVACAHGVFVMPGGLSDPNPIVVGLWEQLLVVYNCTAELMDLKAADQAQLASLHGKELVMLERLIVEMNKYIRRLRSTGYSIRQHIMWVEDGRPLNEPKVWIRN